MQPGADLSQGLDVINSTNLNYFNVAQKAEFFCLKGIFLQRLALIQEDQRSFLNERATEAFSNAVQVSDLSAKAWASWGNFNEQHFKERPRDSALAVQAVSCYLNAAKHARPDRARRVRESVFPPCAQVPARCASADRCAICVGPWVGTAAGAGGVVGWAGRGGPASGHVAGRP